MEKEKQYEVFNWLNFRVMICSLSTILFVVMIPTYFIFKITGVVSAYWIFALAITGNTCMFFKPRMSGSMLIYFLFFTFVTLIWTFGIMYFIILKTSPEKLDEFVLIQSSVASFITVRAVFVMLKRIYLDKKTSKIA